jgi:hypothetical protein
MEFESLRVSVDSPIHGQGCFKTHRLGGNRQLAVATGEPAGLIAFDKDGETRFASHGK